MAQATRSRSRSTSAIVAGRAAGERASIPHHRVGDSVRNARRKRLNGRRVLA